MKKVVRNDLWMMIIAWCLLLNNESLLAMGMVVVASIYLIVYTRNFNFWRMLALCLICFSLSYILANITVAENFKYFNSFAGLTSINVALLNERLYKERLNSLYPIFIIMFISLFIFMAIAIALPETIILSGIKENLIAIIILIFIPYTSIMIFALIRKEYAKKLFLEKIIKINKAKEIIINKKVSV